jgi:hypothetical protein
VLALRNIYGARPTETAAVLMVKLMDFARSNPTEARRQAELEKIILKHVDREIEQQQWRQTIRTKLDAIESAEDIREPAPAILDVLTRYRASNIRELKVIFECLERSRRLRGTAE